MSSATSFAALTLAVLTVAACTSSNDVMLGATEQLDVGAENVPVCAAPCAPGAWCMQLETSAQCDTPPAEPSLPDFVLPFDTATEVACTHASGIGSHSAPNAFFALDLANDYDLPAATVRAAADGTAYVFGDVDGTPCPEPPGTPSQSEGTSCGEGWGNHIRVHHGNGVVSFYVHLDHALVKTGDVVHQGDPIGLEGWTGNAGHRHLHFSLQQIPGATQADWEAHMSWAGDSLPFHFRAQVDGRLTTIDTSTLHCAHANVGAAPPSEQPRMRGAQ